jgi:hypothetical protein
MPDATNQSTDTRPLLQKVAAFATHLEYRNRFRLGPQLRR